MPNIRIEGKGLRTNNQSEPYNGVKQAKRLMKDGYRPYIRIEPDIERDAESFVWGMSFSDPFLTLHDFFDQTETIREYQGLINELDRTLLTDAELIVSKIVEGVFDSVLKIEDDRKFDPSDFDDVEEMSIEIYQWILCYDGIEEDINELSDVLDRIEDLRKTAIEAGYS